MCYVEELVVAPPNVAVRCDQNEYHGDTSHISGNSAGSGEKMNIIRREQASSVHTIRDVSELCTKFNRRIKRDVHSVYCH